MSNQSRKRRLSPADAKRMRALLSITVDRGASEAEAMAAYVERNVIRDSYGCKALGRPPKFAASIASNPALTAQPWVKPKLGKGWEWRQCGKATCHCMKGGRWHGPYKYHKRRTRDKVETEYLGKEVRAA